MNRVKPKYTGQKVRNQNCNTRFLNSDKIVSELNIPFFRDVRSLDFYVKMLNISLSAWPRRLPLKLEAPVAHLTTEYSLGISHVIFSVYSNTFFLDLLLSRG